MRAAEQAAREAALREAREQREAALRAREAEAARLEQTARDEAASLALARRMLADDEAALQARANAPSQPFATVSNVRAPQKLPSTKNEKGLGLRSHAVGAGSQRRVDAFLRAKNIDSRACAKMRGLKASDQIRLLRRLEARPVDSAVVMAAATRGDDFAATAAELDVLPSLALRKSADRLALTSAAVALLATLAPKDQDRVAASFDSPNGLRGLRNVEGFVRACFVGDKQIKNRAASAAGALDRRGRAAAPSGGEGRGRRHEDDGHVPRVRRADAQALRAWLGTRPEGRMRVGRDRPLLQRPPGPAEAAGHQVARPVPQAVRHAQARLWK